jgi:hypothetical protein
VLVVVLAFVFAGFIYLSLEHRINFNQVKASFFRGTSTWVVKLQHQFKPYFFNFQYSYYPWLGIWIKNNFPPGTVIAYDQMGQTPFFAGIDYRFVDIFGLMSRPIAKCYKKRNPSSIKTFINQMVASLFYLKNKNDKTILFSVQEHPEMNQKIVQYVLEQNPDIIMACGFIATWHPWVDLWADPDFKKTYILKHVFGSNWKKNSSTVDYNIFNASIFFRRDFDPDTLPEKKCEFPGVTSFDFYHYTEQTEVRNWLKKYYPQLLPLTY